MTEQPRCDCGKRTRAACLAWGCGDFATLRKPGITQNILAALREIGDMTVAELCDYLGQGQANVSAITSRLISGGIDERRAHVVDWVYDHPGARSYPRAVLRYGPGPNKRKPPAISDGRKRVRLDQGAALRNSSVFRLGMTHREILEDSV